MRVEQIPGYVSLRRAESRKLVKGYIRENPGVITPLCGRCHRPTKPSLVCKHRSQPLELHYCEGCPKLLIRVDVS